MSEYRKIFYPKCPYCNTPTSTKLGSYEFRELVGLSNGSMSDDVVFKCGNCGNRYRVTCSIRFNSRKLYEVEE